MPAGKSRAAGIAFLTGTAARSSSDRSEKMQWNRQSHRRAWALCRSRGVPRRRLVSTWPQMRFKYRRLATQVKMGYDPATRALTAMPRSIAARRWAFRAIGLVSQVTENSRVDIDFPLQHHHRDEVDICANPNTFAAAAGCTTAYEEALRVTRHRPKANAYPASAEDRGVFFGTPARNFRFGTQSPGTCAEGFEPCRCIQTPMLTRPPLKAAR